MAWLMFQVASALQVGRGEMHAGLHGTWCLNATWHLWFVEQTSLRSVTSVLHPMPLIDHVQTTVYVQTCSQVALGMHV